MYTPSKKTGDRVQLEHNVIQGDQDYTGCYKITKIPDKPKIESVGMLNANIALFALFAFFLIVCIVCAYVVLKD